MGEFLSAVPWPDFLLIGGPAFIAGVFTGRFWGARTYRRMR